MISVCQASWQFEIDQLTSVEQKKLSPTLEATSSSYNSKSVPRLRCLSANSSYQGRTRCINTGSRVHEVKFEPEGLVVWSTWSIKDQERIQLYASSVENLEDVKLMGVVSSSVGLNLQVSVSVVRLRISSSTTPSYRVLCYNHGSESISWMQDLQGLDVSSDPETGLRIHGNKLIAIGTQLVAALDINEGNLLWLHPLQNRNTIVSSVLDSANRNVIISTLADGLTSLSLENGKVIWQNPEVYAWHNDLHIQPNSKLIALCSKKHQVVVLDAKKGTIQQSCKAKSPTGFLLGSLEVKASEFGAIDGPNQIWRKIDE